MIKRIIFDLDGTLYDRASPFFSVMCKSIDNWISKCLNISPEEARSLMIALGEKHPHVYCRIAKLNLSPEQFHQAVFEQLEPKLYLSTEPEILLLLEEIKTPKDIVTLASTNYASKVLSALGISVFFCDTYSNIGFGDSKKNVYEFILSKHNLQPSEVLVIGDDERVDIEPARTLGMKTELITGREKFILILQGLINNGT